MTTKFLKTFGNVKPIIQAPMAGVSTVSLAAEVTNCGGIGSIPVSGINLKTDWETFVNTLQEFKNKLNDHQPNTKLLVNLNFFSHDIFDPPTKYQILNWCDLYKNTIPSADVQDWTNISSFSNGNISFKKWELKDNTAVLDRMFNFWETYETLTPKIVSFHFGYPSSDTINRFQQLGIKVFITATSLEEAKFLIHLKVDGLILQGDEAGGHRGDFIPTTDPNLNTFFLFQTVKSYVASNGLSDQTFLIPTGGIMDSHDFSLLIEQGSSAIQVGSVFLGVSGLPTKAYFDKLVSTGKSQREVPKTVLTALVSGKAARAVETSLISQLSQNYHKLDPKHQELPEYGYRYKGYKDTVKKLKGKVDLDLGFHLAGANYFKMNTNRSVEEIISDITKDL